MTLLVIAVAFLVIIDIFGISAIMIAMHRQFEALITEREKFNANFLQHLAIFFDGLKKKDEQQRAIIQEISKQSDILKEQYEAIDEAYEHMNARYMEICEHYSNLLKCWSGVEERYSDCYEQLKYQNERFDRFDKYIDEQRQSFWQTEEDIDMDISPLVGGQACEYNYAGECQNEDCPALNMYCTADDPGDCQYSNLAYEPIEAEA